jgi:predicted nuclease of predicted toxin-antitoxin system
MPLDENLSLRPGAMARKLAASVHHARDLFRPGAPDGEIWLAASQQALVLVTRDRGFLRHAATAPHSGPLLIALRRQAPENFARAILRALQRYARAAAWADATVEVREATVRRRVARPS